MTTQAKKLRAYNPKSIMHRKKVARNALRIAFVSLLLIIVLAPFYIAVLYAFRPGTEVPANRLQFSANPTWENFRLVLFENKLFPIGFKNSVINTIPCVIILMAFTSMAAWVLARNETPFYNIM